ncbi:hypothetical protein OGAPHI_002643 [Ogataea philodendri]|uniref:Uncharacterized protein n=1 Tax=Ogataea philodendri TaxID=1378263 RepID=A0A9P8PAW1_9ASCO|nr:uncharacterized protein OGAPHI_002643 [Ogataea philodendri]KAH3668888.1 hypothetical protein OGAPHI_002643 [Ogataea philodendri]
MVFSPPESSSMSLNRFIGGMAWYFTPCKYGSSSSSRVRYADPPRGDTFDLVSSLYTPSILAEMWLKVSMNCLYRLDLTSWKSVTIFFSSCLASEKSASKSASLTLTFSSLSLAFIFGFIAPSSAVVWSMLCFNCSCNSSNSPVLYSSLSPSKSISIPSARTSSLCSASSNGMSSMDPRVSGSFTFSSLQFLRMLIFSISFFSTTSSRLAIFLLISLMLDLSSESPSSSWL